MQRRNSDSISTGNPLLYKIGYNRLFSVHVELVMAKDSKQENVILNVAVSLLLNSIII